MPFQSPEISAETAKLDHHARLWVLRVRCPYCGQVHVHGWPDQQPGVHLERLAKCSRGHYRITFPDVPARAPKGVA